MSRAGLTRQLAAAHEELPQWVDDYLRRIGYSWQQLENGDLFKELRNVSSLDDFVTLVVIRDPVYFAESFYRERDKPGNPNWRLFDYQKPAMRWTGNLILYCGAETGKTRQFLVKIGWRAVTQVGSQLVAAALDGHLQLLYEDLVWQFDSHPILRKEIDWKASKAKPYPKLFMTNGNRIYFRPAGIDGKAIRGIHVRAAYMDEANCIYNATTWGNFFSRLLPGAPFEIAAVPDGVVTSRFSEFGRTTPEVDPLVGPPPNADKAATYKFRWPKTLMPPPFWTPEREKFFIEKYGGRDTSDYQQNVLGLDGSPANQVFPWPVFSRCLQYLSEYTFVRLLYEASSDQVFISAYRLRRGYRISNVQGDEDLDEVATSPMEHFHEEAFSKDQFDAAGTFRSLLPRLSGHLLASADIGKDEPTEALIQEVRGESRRWLARVQLRGFDYDDQDRILRALDTHYQPSHGWGLDATGVGSAVQHHLEDPEKGRPLDVLGFVMNAKTPDVNLDTGATITEKDGKQRMVTHLELGTRLLEHQIQRRRAAIPYDTEVMQEFQGLQARKNSRGERSFKGPDHIVTAALAAELRNLENNHGAFHGTVEFAVPAGGPTRIAYQMDGYP